MQGFLDQDCGQGILYRMTERKQRLFAVGCCRRVWQHLSEASLVALSVIERFADGVATLIELQAAEETAGYATKAAQTAEAEAVWCAANPEVYNAVWSAAQSSAGMRNDSRMAGPK